MPGRVGSVENISIDRIDEGGRAIHVRTDGSELNLGPLPSNLLDEEIVVETWASGEARPLDPRYHLSRTASTRRRSGGVKSQLSIDGRSLDPGDHVFGVVDETDGRGYGTLVTSGYRIGIEGARAGAPVLAEISETHEKRFGANTAEADRVDRDSLFGSSLAANLGVKCLKPNGQWGPPDLGPLEIGLLSETADGISTGETMDVLNTGFNPHLGLQVAIELLYQADPGSDIVLYTPGSSVHWGQKGQVRKSYGNYGFSNRQGHCQEVVPMEDMYAHASIGTDGTIHERSKAELQSRLIFTKSLDEVLTIDAPTAVIVDSTSRSKGGDQERVMDIVETMPNVSIVMIDSPFTKNEIDGVDRYGPVDFPSEARPLPDKRLIQDTIADFAAQVSRGRARVDDSVYTAPAEGGHPLPPTTTDLLGLLRERPIEVSAVDSGNLGPILDGTIERYENLKENGLGRAANKVYSMEMLLERLPVPVNRHDTWVRERYEEGERYIPDPVSAQIEQLDAYGGKISDLAGPQAIFGAVKLLEKGAEMIQEASPMYERIRSEAEIALDEGTRIALFTPSKSWRRLLESSLIADCIPDSEIGNTVLIVDCDSMRDIPPCGRLYCIGPQRPQYAGIYVHPRAQRCIVLTYDRGWTTTIERHAKEYIDRLEGHLPKSDGRLYPLPTIEIDDSTLDSGARDDVDGPRIQGGADSATEASTGSDEEKLIDPGEESTNRSESDEVHGGRSLPDVDIDELAQRRLLDIVDFAPTKNAELASEWGLASGKEVYQYMSEHLLDFYTRNDSKLIVPTEEGEQLAERIRKHQS